tara:strand:- start:5290 stop:5829 length:540 start_codon:yes stop_codon:yes gene_type:complete
LRTEPLKIIIAGGGTGGHLFPALAIAVELKSRNETVSIHFVGSTSGIEADSFKKDQLQHTLLNVRGFNRSFSLRGIVQNIGFPVRFLSAYIKSRKLITKFNPDVVVGTGGYASGLPLLAAVHKKIPTLIHEQNSFPGFTTRWLSTKVDRLCLSYEDSVNYLKKKSSSIRAILSGKACLK